MYGLNLGRLGIVGGKTWNERTALWPLGTEPGLWIDPSTTTDSYQDSAGTTPLSAIGTLADSSNPIGLQLDRKYGPVLGPETFSAFDTLGAGWVNNGDGTYTATAATTSAEQTATPGSPYLSGKMFVFTFEIISRSAGSVRAYVNGSGYGPDRSSVGIYSDFCVGVGAAPDRCKITAFTGFTGTVRPISVRSLSGLHLSQATSAARPFASARTNLLTKTETPTDASVWQNYGAATNTSGASDPIGGSTAVQVDMPAINTGLKLICPTVFAGSKYSASIYIRADSPGEIRLFEGTGSVSIDVLLSVTTEWQRVTAAGDSSITNASELAIYRGSAGQLSKVYVWHPQFEYGITANTYQRVNTAADYDAASFPIYDKFDAVDDALLSATVAAGVVGNSNMDCLIAVRRNSGATTILGLYETDGSGKIFGIADSGDSVNPCFDAQP